MPDTNKEWIRSQLTEMGWNSEAKLRLYKYVWYSQFREATGSLMSIESYKRLIRRVFHTSEDVKITDDLKTYIQDKTSEINDRTISYKGPRIIDVDMLLDACSIDLDEWYVDSSEVNKWEVGRKNKKVDLNWSDGVMDGSVVDVGDFSIEPMIQVKVKLKRKILQKSKLPDLKKIEVRLDSKKKKTKRLKDNDIKTALVLADAQMGFTRDFKSGKLFPLHDRRVFSIALRVAEEKQPNVIVLNGDFFDFAEMSDKFLNSPEFYYSIQPAFIEFGWWMKQFKDVCPNSDIVYLSGNHEDRLRKHIVKYSAYAHGMKSIDRLEGYDVLSIPNLASFDTLGIEWKGPYGSSSADYWLTSNFMITHGILASGSSGLTVKNIVRDATCSMLVGHIHKFESAEKVIDIGGSRREIQVWTFGTMCMVNGAVPSRYSKVNWQQGFGLINYKEDFDNLVEIVPIKVTDGETMFEKNHIIGYDPTKDISHDTGWGVLNITDEIQTHYSRCK